jgi:hypothetical protein
MQFLIRFAVSVGAFWSIDSIVFRGVHFDAACIVLGYIVAGVTQVLWP